MSDNKGTLKNNEISRFLVSFCSITLYNQLHIEKVLKMIKHDTKRTVGNK